MLFTRIITGTILIASLIGLVWIDSLVSIGTIQSGAFAFG